MLEDGAKFFRISILFPWLHAKYSKQCLYHNHYIKFNTNGYDTKIVHFYKSLLFSIWYHKK